MKMRVGVINFNNEQGPQESCVELIRRFG